MNDVSDIALFCVAFYSILKVSLMSLEFLERMRAKQNKKRFDYSYETVTIKTAQGDLLDETGEPVTFRRYGTERPDYERAKTITARIDIGAMGFIFPMTMLDYYRTIPVLEPVRD